MKYLMPPDLVIFDCDGVVLDSEIVACRVEAELFADAGFPITVEHIVRHYVGKSYASMVAEVEAEFGRPPPPDFEARHEAATLARFAIELEAMPGIVAVLDRLTRARTRTGIASSSSLARLHASLGKVGLWERFAPHVYSAEQVRHGKPAPGLFLLAAERLCAPPARAVVIEDSPTGVKGALAAGMTAIGFVGGGHCGPDHARKLTDAGATAVIEHLDALPALLVL